VDLAATGARQAQQKVWEVKDLSPGKHIMEIVHRSAGPVAVDALVVQ
jgi:hypothetical protein